VERARALINGVLNYSRVDGQNESAKSVDVGALVRQIAETLGVDDERLQVDNEVPVLDTYAIQLDQVLTNLVGNAFKYHHDPARANVRVAAMRVDANTLRFSVSDDGPGIEPCLHERIFRVFQTLAIREDIDSTGVGLSIVKKTVEGVGGCSLDRFGPGTGHDLRVHLAAGGRGGGRPASSRVGARRSSGAPMSAGRTRRYDFAWL